MKNPKKPFKGEFELEYMEAAFNKEDSTGEFFLEFKACIWDYKLVEAFKAQGAFQVSSQTFAHNDGHASAASALLRIREVQIKTGLKHICGACPQGLSEKINALEKLSAASQGKSLDQEFSEKQAAALVLSMKDVKTDVKAVKDDMQSHGIKLEVLEGGIQSQNIKLESIEDGVQSQAVKLESHGVDLGDIKQGVCNVIPDLQAEIKGLKEALGRSNAARDTTEGKLGHKTRIVNQQETYIMQLEEGQKLYTQEKLAWVHERNSLLAKIVALQEELDKTRDLNKMLEKAGLLVEIMSSTLADERSAKRPRA